MVGWLITFGVVSVLGIGGWIGWSKLNQEHREAAGLPLNAVDFSRLKDGNYHGAYSGGMYRWRANECDVTVSSGKVTAIQLATSKETGQHQTLYDRVIQAQSLQVDIISGATLTSKAFLQAVENALLQAQQEK